MEGLVAVFIPFAFLATVIIITYFFLSYSHKERMGMLERGLTPPPTRGGLTGMSSLWMGLVAVAIGAALILTQVFGFDKEHMVGGIIFVFIGAALLSYYRITVPKREQEIRLREEYQIGLMQQMEALRADSTQP